MYLLIATLFIFLLYVKYGFYYARGMAIYCWKNNTKVGPQNEDCWRCVRGEINEFQKALNDGKLVGIFMEFFDVVHGLFKLFVVKCLPYAAYTRTVFWLPFFIVFFPTSVKLAYRYETNNCIRNHRNPLNRRHICDHYSIDL
jgi:hypothetical protein